MTVLTKPALSAAMIAALPTNGNNEISAADFRGILQSYIDSLLALQNPTPQIVTSDINFIGNVNIANTNDGYKLVLDAASFVNQQPASTDTPLQIEFGAAQGTGLDPVMISALGAITFNQTGQYFAVLETTVGRAGTAGASIVVLSFLVDAAYVGSVAASIVDIADARFASSSSSFFEPTLGQVWTFNIVRDSTGDNSGGLFTFNPTLIGVPSTPSARIKIYRRQ